MRLPFPVAAITALFAAALVYLVVVALVPKRVPVFEATVPRAVAAGGGEDTVTIDARDGDTWRFFSFTRGWLTAPDTASWDVAVQRFRIRSAGAVHRLESVPFDSVIESGIGSTPGSDSSFGSTPGLRPGSVQTQAGQDLGRWYRYSMFSHLLLPKPATYVFRTRDGGATKLQLLSYYCPGPEPGCVTFRFARLQ